VPVLPSWLAERSCPSEGIRQFLDIGTGLPTENNTHEVAQRIAPDSRIVYVDRDPLVLTHARALLTSTPEGVTQYVDADLRESHTILKAAAHRFRSRAAARRAAAAAARPRRSGRAAWAPVPTPDQAAAHSASHRPRPL
jgi:hypothetical protein